MPQGENYWNPYRWVTVSDRSVSHDEPHYHHTFSGFSGRIWCELEALTPLLIGDGGAPDIQFVRYQHNSQPYIPATSLKGAIRSLAEVVGNATVPFPRISVDEAHRLSRARKEVNGISRFDVVARTFGYLDGGNVVAGLIHFSDAEFIESPQPPTQWRQQHRIRVVVGRPEPNHKAFYPGSNKRKFYHHHPGATQLVEAPQNIDQVNHVTPAPPGTRFNFTVNFTNLRETELNLLLYCLILEEQVTVTLSPAALGRHADQDAVTLEGPLRHKIGGAKPQGAGSIRIQIARMELRQDATARYRGGNATETLDETEINARIVSFSRRTDQTMKELRAMLIYTTEDPRDPIDYPEYDWFQDERDQPLAAQIRLKPTL